MGREYWKVVEDTDGQYYVSNMGRVANSNGQEIKVIVDREGYYLVDIYISGKRRRRRLHRLVAMAFIANPENKPTVNHVDENKSNNAAVNLEWTSHKEQVNHGTRNNRAMMSMTPCAVEKVDKDGTILAVYPSIRGAARHLKCNPNKILNALKGRQKTSGGYIWRYHDKKTTKSYGRPHSVGVVQLDLNGKIIARYCSIQSAARTLGISPAGICECLHGKRNTNAGYLWHYDESPLPEYQNQTIPINQYDIDGHLIAKFNSVSDAARAVKSSTGDICRCLKGKRRTSHGFIWKYA